MYDTMEEKLTLGCFHSIGRWVNAMRLEGNIYLVGEHLLPSTGGKPTLQASQEHVHTKINVKQVEQTTRGA